MFLTFLYRYACDERVIRLFRERTLGNSSTQLQKQLREQHSEHWLSQVVKYVTDCAPFKTATSLVTSVVEKYPDPPKTPTPKWFQTAYSQDILTRLDAVKAQITSVFGDILKLDSTKQVINRLIKHLTLTNGKFRISCNRITQIFEQYINFQS